VETPSDDGVTPAGRYTHGHHPSVVGMHATRTAENSAGYLLGRLHPGMALLDVGCGPGTITLGLAERVAPGPVVAIDMVAEVVEQAKAAAAAAGAANIEFRTGDVCALDELDASFDVVHAHQVLQHLTDPVRALREMARVLRPGGIVAVRDADYASMVWAPAEPRLDRWLDLYHQVARRNGAEPDAGRRLLGWLQAAGFDDVEAGASAVAYGEDAGRRFWGEGWAARAISSTFATQAVDYGLTTPDELQAISEAFRHWAGEPAGFWTYTNGEAVARKPG
jgi:ubiquinone/menaquinone biosynthesis C-methylase UbiE